MLPVEKHTLKTLLMLCCALGACTPHTSSDSPVNTVTAPTAQPTPVISVSPLTQEVINPDGPNPSPRPSSIMSITPSPPLSSAQPTPTPFEVQVHLYVENDNREEVDDFTLNVEGEDTDFNKKYDFTASNNPKSVQLPCGLNYLLTVQNSIYPPSVLRVNSDCRNLARPHNIRPNAANTAYFIRENSIGSALEAKNRTFYDSSLSLEPRITGSSLYSAELKYGPIHTPMHFEFSVPMETNSVENNFSLRAGSQDTPLVIARDEAVFQGSFSNALHLENDLIFDKRHFNFQWNAEATQVEVSFKTGFEPLYMSPGYFRYTLGFDSAIRSAAGVERAGYYFSFSPKSLSFFESHLAPRTPVFSQDYQIANIQKTDEGYQLKFDAIMFMPVGPVDNEILLAGGMRDRRVQNRNALGDPLSIPLAPAEYPGNVGFVTGFNAAGNYLISSSTMPANTTWKSLGGEVVYNFEDETHTSVYLKWPTNATEQNVESLILKYTDILLPQGQPLRFALVKRDGQLSQALSVDSLTSAEQMNTLTAVLPLSENPWTLRSEAGQWVLRFEDTLGEYVGLKLLEGNATAGTVTWKSGEPLSGFTTSSQIYIKPKATVLSVNGNHIDPAQAAVLLD